MAANMSLFLLCFVFYVPYWSYAQTDSTDIEGPTTSAVPITTTTADIPTTAPPTEIPTNTDLAECTCDLTANGCDINCCCDPECTDEDRLAFSSCIDDFNVVDSQACVRSDVVFSSNTPYVVNQTNPDLFCVQFDNFEERNYYTSPDLLKDAEGFDSYMQQYASAYSFQQITTTNNISTDYYRSGDPIYTVYETNALGMLGLPGPLSSQLCTDTNPAAYLYSQLLECTREITNLELECDTIAALNAATYYKGLKVLVSPKAFDYLNDSVVNTTTTVSPVSTDSPLSDGEVPLYNTSYALSITPVGPHACIDGGYNGTCTFPDDSVLPAPAYDPTTGTCNNSIVKMTYKITWNGIDGIANITVTFTFNNIMENMLPLTQNFETQFAKDNETEPFQRSGNPGYLPGEPVMAGFLVENLNDDGTKAFAIDLNSDRNNWVTMVTSSPNGECDAEVTNRVPVTFGTSMRSGCFISIFFSNISTVCTQINDEALNALKGPNPPNYVATFGNTPIEKAQDWVQINDPAPTTPGSSDGECDGIVTGLHIEFIYANVGSIANPQAKIIGGAYQYHRQKIRYQCMGAYCMPGNEAVSQRIEITSSVGFIDASTRAVPQSAGKPKVTARLPEDFFLPFS